MQRAVGTTQMDRSRHYEAPPRERSRRRDYDRNFRSDGFMRRALTVSGLLIGTVVLLWALWFTRRVWLMGFAGVLLAILLRRLAGWVSRHTRLSPRWSLAVVCLSLAVLLGFSGWLVAKPLSQQIGQLGERLPKAIEHVRHSVEGSSWGQHLPRQLQSGGDISSGAQKAFTHLTRI